MGVDWDETVLDASLRRARDWASTHPIRFAFLFALPPFLIPAGISRFNVPAGLIALVVALLVWFLALVVLTLLSMLYETRAAVGRLVAPVGPVEEASDFDCALVPGEDDRYHLRVSNHGTTGRFHARVMEVAGVEANGTWPLTLRWQGDESASRLRISRGDSELVCAVRVRGRRAVDFLCPVGGDRDHQRVQASADGDLWWVRARIVVFNESDGGDVGRQERELQLAFANGSDRPAVSQLGPVAPEA